MHDDVSRWEEQFHAKSGLLEYFVGCEWVSVLSLPTPTLTPYPPGTSSFTLPTECAIDTVHPLVDAVLVSIASFAFDHQWSWHQSNHQVLNCNCCLCCSSAFTSRHFYHKCSQVTLARWLSWIFLVDIRGRMSRTNHLLTTSGSLGFRRKTKHHDSVNFSPTLCMVEGIDINISLWHTSASNNSQKKSEASSSL